MTPRQHMILTLRQLIQQRHWRASWSIDVDEMVSDIVDHISTVEFSSWLVAAVLLREQDED